MVANPMQKKARNSFLLGMLITLIVCLIIFALVYFLVINKDKKEEKEEVGEIVKAYVLNQDVRSGDIITSNLLTQMEVYSTMVPSNYVDVVQLGSIELQDEYGNVVYTNSKGELYMIVDGNMQYKTTGEKGKENRIIIEEDENGFYKTKTTGEKEYIKFVSVPVVAKIDMYKNSIVTLDSLSKSDAIVTDSTRRVEYNMLVLPTTIMEGDYIDIRLTLPNGQDLIVASKKEVKTLLGDTIGLDLTEEEILMMDSAIVEAYIMIASKLYAIQYIEPGNQKAAQKTYTPTVEVQGLIERNPNIKETAKVQLKNRFDLDIRTWTDNSRINYIEDAQGNLETGLQEEIENAKAAREAYLAGMESY